MPDKETLVKGADAALYRAKEGGEHGAERAGECIDVYGGAAGRGG